MGLKIYKGEDKALHIADVMPCFVYYMKRRGENFKVETIGYAELYVSSEYIMIRESSDTRDIYHIDDVEILEVN